MLLVSSCVSVIGISLSSPYIWYHVVVVSFLIHSIIKNNDNDNDNDNGNGNDNDNDNDDDDYDDDDNNN